MRRLWRSLWFFFASDDAKRQRAYREILADHPDADEDAKAMIRKLIGL